MSRIWPADMIREMLALAEATGEAYAELENPAEAAKFRFAVYTFRKTQRLGEDLAISIEGRRVWARQRPSPMVVVGTPGPLAEGA